MISFTIDTSVFAIPNKCDDLDIEKRNLCMLRKNIMSLDTILEKMSLEKMRSSDSVTVSFMNKIPKQLWENKYPYTASGIDKRIKDLLNARPQYSKELGLDSSVFEKLDELMNTIRLKKDKETQQIRKGRIGIYNNIPNRDSDPDEKYITNTLADVDTVYPQLAIGIKNTFKRYLGYIANLNYKYDASHSNFIILGGNQEKKDISVKLKTAEGEVESHVAVLGIQKVKVSCPLLEKKCFKDLSTACTMAQKEIDSKVVFGNEINKKNIEDGISSGKVSPARIYYYLQTLFNVSNIIVNKNINLDEQNISEQNISILVEMLNAHGLLCSSEDKKYNKCEKREFENHNAKKEQFDIHLKPFTYPRKQNLSTTYAYNESERQGTVRIYVKWNKEKRQMLVGWIGKHPPICKECENSKCPEHPSNKNWSIS
jgi:hypothetical protein